MGKVMKIKNQELRELDNLEKYVITPNVNFYGGYIHDGEDINLCDDETKEEDYYIRIKQEIKNNVLITDGKKEYKMKNDKSVKETWHQEVEINKDQLLIYLVGQGFVLPEYKMITIDKAQELYEILKNKKEE